MLNFPFSIGDKSIMVIIDSRPRMVSLDSEQGKKLREALKKSQHDDAEIRSLADVTSYMTRFSMGRVTVDDRDQLRLDGKVVDYGMTAMIVGMFREGSDPSILIRFLTNVAENPNKNIAEDLYAFISKGMLPITPEGHFLAFKRVKKDFFDIHSGRVRYQVGDEPFMTREECDPDRNNTCSRGLHACSYEYLPHFSTADGGHVMIVKIDPRDVTAIPNDYNQTKLRCCRMKVVDEVPEAEVKTHFERKVDTRYSDPVVADDSFSDEADAGPEEGVKQTQPGEITLEEVQDKAYADGEELAEECGDLVSCDIASGKHYHDLIERFCLTYPIHFVRGYLDGVPDLDEYHSERAVVTGREDATAVFESGVDVEESFNWGKGDNFHNIPEEHEEAYIFGYLDRMHTLQSEAHPDV